MSDGASEQEVSNQCRPWRNLPYHVKAINTFSSPWMGCQGTTVGSSYQKNTSPRKMETRKTGRLPRAADKRFHAPRTTMSERWLTRLTRWGHLSAWRTCGELQHCQWMMWDIMCMSLLLLAVLSVSVSCRVVSCRVVSCRVVSCRVVRMGLLPPWLSLMLCWGVLLLMVERQRHCFLVFLFSVSTWGYVVTPGRVYYIRGWGQKTDS